MRNQKNLLKVLAVSVLIIITASFEAFIKGKSRDLFILFQRATGGSFGDYINFTILNYLLDIVEPVIISLFFVIAINKLKITRLTKFIMAGLVFIKILLKVFKFEFTSPFFYLLILLYILLFVEILKMPIHSEVD
ncbi:hypothetical protein [Lagierella sp.]|uniref:hypothetical protein n=1 Tax=Lagierella sp. TaxID=2849657 RepID=UPI002624908D|nr:hypothetical protein [Lagierella sp.]